jgi:hypothetical protein
MQNGALSNGYESGEVCGIGIPSLVVHSFVFPRGSLPMRSVLNLAVFSRIGNIALLYGRQSCEIAYFGSIEALTKVPVKGGPRNIPLFLAAQLSVVALAQCFQAILQIPVVIGVRHFLLLIGAELR